MVENLIEKINPELIKAEVSKYEGVYDKYKVGEDENIINLSLNKYEEFISKLKMEENISPNNPKISRYFNGILFMWEDEEFNGMLHINKDKKVRFSYSLKGKSKYGKLK